MNMNKSGYGERECGPQVVINLEQMVFSSLPSITNTGMSFIVEKSADKTSQEKKLSSDKNTQSRKHLTYKILDSE